MDSLGPNLHPRILLRTLLIKLSNFKPARISIVRMQIAYKIIRRDPRKENKHIIRLPIGNEKPICLYMTWSWRFDYKQLWLKYYESQEEKEKKCYEYLVTMIF